MKGKISPSEKAIKLIKNNQVSPIPKWKFTVKNIFLWIVVGIITVGLTVGFGLVWFSVVDNIIFPYFWLILSVVFGILAYTTYLQTNKSYRVERWQAVLGVIVVGLLFGRYIHKFGWARKIDNGFESSVPYYRHMSPMKQMWWSSPENGYLSGEIIDIDKNRVQILDFNNHKWQVTIDSAVVRGRVNLVVGQKIKIVGRLESDNHFFAKEIRPWMGMGQNMMKENW